jgi:seryl-tRNA synthetase
LKKYQEELDSIEGELMRETLKLPNKTHPLTPIGDESKSEILFTKGKPPTFSFSPKSHLEIGESLDLFDFDNGAKLTGAKFMFMKNQAALLELALINFGMSKAIKKGFTPILTPDVTQTDVLEGWGFQPRDESGQTYRIMDQNMDLSLIGTSEAPIAGMLANEMLYENQLPLKYVAFSHCFRKEAGRGALAKGIYRLHQFSKVELFVFWEPHQSDQMFEEIVELQTELLDDLGLAYRGVNMASYELGASAYKKIDLEWWFPSRNDFGEITSASNWTSYQSRRFNIQYFKEQNNKYLVHTLNGTAVAIPRLIMAILENFQNEKGDFEIPDALKPFYLHEN